ncbi:2-iminoacetate synthase ThiH [Alteromonas stellipolaris]|uniref:2-iminoacetate synthase ThiH n=1 Tax=Alteromonas stellipolaris TaxID=233316 RepID=UPI001DA1CCBF|nr:2-iminoacetate synthase ThiH [Alteromonas stellipolaris]MBZ2160720.1 2-iminoacetate synthase ThiH [Alteromonas stellipolaris]
MRIASTLMSQDLSDIALSIQSKTSKHVEQALSKTSRNLDDFMALISPAATPYVEEMASQSQMLTRARFGNTMGLFVPLYLANLCANECTYCGFTMSNKIKRTVLNINQIEREIAAITDMGFSQVLLVTGEHEQKVGMPYFSEVIPTIRAKVSNVMMEVQPLPQKDYETLKLLGVDAVLVYQETYNPQEYARYHTRGKKQDFLWRLQASDRIGAAGIDKIGIGALLGLGDWRTDSVMTALHGQLIQQHYWRSRVAISFPRLRQCEGNTNDSANLLTQQFPNETQLLQLICAHRLFNPQAELSLSTRESARFRDGVLPLGITTMSAGSQTQPGGYSAPSEALNQFDIDDTRSVNLVAAAIEAKGLEPVWKDWMTFS